MTDVDKVREALRKHIDTIPESDDWWCPHCGTTDCSYTGRCTQCGTPIEDCQPDTTIIDELRKALTLLQGKVLVDRVQLAMAIGNTLSHTNPYTSPERVRVLIDEIWTNLTTTEEAENG